VDLISRPYQLKLEADIYREWSTGARVVVAVAPTGAGKTVIFSRILKHYSALAMAISHRKELVTQMAVTLARYDVRHSIMAGANVVKTAVNLQMLDCGRSLYSPTASTIVAGIDTLRLADTSQYARRLGLWIGDEGHHFLEANKWGEGVRPFDGAYGALFTATPNRADGRGLGRHAAGIADAMVQGPTLRELINDGWLCDYRIFCPETKIDLTKVDVSNATGDFNAVQLRTAVHESQIVGDVVEHYLRLVPGKSAVCFAVDVESATDIAANFNRHGVKAEVVTAKTPAALRDSIIRKFKAGEIRVLVNVDLFGEGFDLPALEVVIFARPTESFPLYAQQFGRSLRPFYAPGFDLNNLPDRLAAIAASIKPRAIVIDHVGNVVRHNGPPDVPRMLTLDSRDRSSGRKNDPDIEPYRNCPACTAPYRSFSKLCPYCGHYPEPAARSTPEQVKGDLTELDPQVLRLLRGEIDRIDGMPNVADDATGAIPGAIRKRHWERYKAQSDLRHAIGWWAGYWRACGRDDSDSYRRFMHEFGIDVLTAQTLGRPDAEALAARVNARLAKFGFDPNTLPRMAA
jgi:DNA repair protein RadD